MTDDPRQMSNSQGTSDDSGSRAEDPASAFDRRWEAMIDREPGASALDPALWNRIRREARTRRRGYPRRTVPSWRPVRRRLASGPQAVLDSLPAVSPAQWHRAGLIFSAVVLVGLILLVMPGGSVDPRHGAVVREAPWVAAPVPESGCHVEPLTRAEVLGIVVDVGHSGFVNTWELFPTPPSSPWSYPHTETWLPESDETVEIADGRRPVRIPTAKEFRGASTALDRYLRCQDEGTNLQLWALESPAEVQRQVLAAIAVENGWTRVDAWMPEEITETQILRAIDRLGPERRSGGASYLYVEAPGDDRVRANPRASAARVADHPETGDVEYAWIGTQWVDPETGEVVSSRGAGLESTPVSRDGGVDNLVVMILRHDPTTGAWLVEWLVPTI